MSKMIVRSALVVALAGAILGLAQTARAQGEKKADKAEKPDHHGQLVVHFFEPRHHHKKEAQYDCRLY